MAHTHDVNDTGTPFSIDPVSRSIFSQSADKPVIIQTDHNSERFTFQIPRKVDDHDMSLCDKVQVHYINIGEDGKRTPGLYAVKDLHVNEDDPDIVEFTWLISQNATLYVGALNFAIKFLCTSNYKITYSWNTTVYTGVSVGTGIDNTQEIVEQYADVLQDWYNEIITAGDMGVNAILQAQQEGIEALRGIVQEEVDAITSENILELSTPINAAKETALSEIKVAADEIVNLVIERLPRAEGALF